MRWDQRSLEILDAVHQKARELGKPVPWRMADMTALVHPTGMPVGNNSWLKYRVIFAGIEIGISDRHSSGRRNSNFKLQAPGESCLMVGLPGILDFQDAVIRELGGQLVDSWLQRADFCADLSGVSIYDYLLPAFNAKHFVSTASIRTDYAKTGDATGFSFCSEGLTLRVYDKLKEVQRKDELYKQAMVQHRWGGQLPKSATRIEWQTRKPWLGTASIRSRSDLMSQLGTIVARLTDANSLQLVRFTTAPPDRKNGHQGRAKTDPHWAEINLAFQTGFPEGIKPLPQLQRSGITGDQLIKIAVGCLTKAAAMQGIHIHSAEDATAFLKRHSPNDAKWHQSWETHAIKLGIMGSDLRNDT